jgi:CspA family cold shock protein
MDGFKSLTEGDRVEFEVTRGPKGLQASNVRRPG